MSRILCIVDWALVALQAALFCFSPSSFVACMFFFCLVCAILNEIIRHRITRFRS